MSDFQFWQISSESTQIHLLGYGDFAPSHYLNCLNDEELSRYLTFKHIKRRREFIATRILREKVLGKQMIQYNSIGAPYIDGVGFISISHSSYLVGLAFNSSYQIGLDLETPRPNILEVCPKFLASSEKDFFDETNKLEMTRLWSAKEAMYKLAGRKKIIFKEDLLLSKTPDRKWLGRIINPDHSLLVELDIFDHQGTVVSINRSAVERI